MVGFMKECGCSGMGLCGEHARDRARMRKEQEKQKRLLYCQEVRK